MNKEYEYQNFKEKAEPILRELQNLLDKHGVKKQEQRQGKYKEHVWFFLTSFEREIDQFETLLKKFKPENSDFLFLDITENIVCDLLEDKKIRKEYGAEIVKLAHDLDSVSYEWVQILKEERPCIYEEVRSQKTSLPASNYLFGSKLVTLSTMRSIDFDPSQFFKECESGKLLKKHFENLKMAEQRIHRLEIAKKLLDKLFEFEKKRFKINKKSLAD